jgi:hypothetical protein
MLLLCLFWYNYAWILLSVRVCLYQDVDNCIYLIFQVYINIYYVSSLFFEIITYSLNHMILTSFVGGKIYPWLHIVSFKIDLFIFVFPSTLAMYLIHNMIYYNWFHNIFWWLLWCTLRKIYEKYCWIFLNGRLNE